MKVSTLKKDISPKSALRFVILLSLVSLFADMTYEGARSITGPYLAILGANAAIVGFVAGFGELVGYALRIGSGYAADRTNRYWTITIIGYVLNLLVVPLLALVDHWWLAALLMILERTGKAIRVPPRDAMLSHAGQKMGMGWVFGLHEAIDQLGAMSGPLIVALTLYFHGGYRHSFAILFIPAICSLSILMLAQRLYPHPHHLESAPEKIDTRNIHLTFWLYLIGASLIAAGYADFTLMAYHFQKNAIVSPIWIPIAYAFAMGINSFSAPTFGYLYDRYGFSVLIIATVISCPFAPLAFFGNATIAMIGIGLWSIGISAHESLMRAIVANMVPAHKRSTAYGIFNAGFGIFWFLGSVLMGVLYDVSISALVVFSIVIQLVAVPLLFIVMKRLHTNQ